MGFLTLMKVKEDNIVETNYAQESTKPYWNGDVNMVKITTYMIKMLTFYPKTLCKKFCFFSKHKNLPIPCFFGKFADLRK